MIIFSINHKFEPSPLAHLPKVDGKWENSITEFLLSLTKKYSQIKSIYLSLNDNRSDTAI
jgi:hypothetical protein